MRKTHDYLHRYRGIWRDGGICRIEVYEPAPGEGTDRPVIVCSELEENTNTSVTNLAEILAAEVIARHFPWLLDAPDGNEQPVVWVERYPAERGLREAFDRVTFSPWRITTRWEGGVTRRCLGTPHWRRLTQEEVSRLLGRASVAR